MRAELTGFPSIDKLWLKYYGEEVLHRPLPEGSMYDYLTSCNADRMDEAALNYFGKKVTHRQMQEKIDACARALTAYGVRAGAFTATRWGVFAGGWKRPPMKRWNFAP